MKAKLLFFSIAIICCATGLAFAQSPCDRLKALSLPDTSISAVEYVSEGPFRAQGSFSGAPAAKMQQPAASLPAYCRVALVLTPSKDSHVESEVWLPVEDWNGKLLVVGNGGWAGSISFPAMASSLKDRYATASTDTGHKAADAGGNGMFALGHPEKIVDFGHRALHETTVKAKAIVAAFYGNSPKYSYYNGCSTGGRQGLVEASRYPEDFDGIVAGAPANPHIYLHASGIELNMQLRKNPDLPLTPGKVATLQKAVMGACDLLDGVKDGILNNPEKCRFDPATLICKGADSDACLTALQAEAARQIFADVKTGKGEVVWTGFAPGSELQGTPLAAKSDPNTPPSPFLLDSIRILGYQDANWDWRTWNLDRDLALTTEKAGYIDVHTYDLSSFKARGGKLLLYHGWVDPGITPGNTVNYYKGVLSKMGPKQDGWLRLFMMPGVQHCAGGPGPDQFDKVAVIERWRETGIAPDQIVATRISGASVDMTRPICPYPQVPTYKGSGSTNDAANFTCK